MSLKDVYENFEEMFFEQIMKFLFKFFSCSDKSRIGDLKVVIEPIDNVMFRVCYAIKKLVPSQASAINDFLVENEQSYVFASLKYEDLFLHNAFMLPRGEIAIVVGDRIKGMGDSSYGFCTQIVYYVQVQTSQGIFWVREDNLTDKVFF